MKVWLIGIGVAANTEPGDGNRDWRDKPHQQATTASTMPTCRTLFALIRSSFFAAPLVSLHPILHPHLREVLLSRLDVRQIPLLLISDHLVVVVQGLEGLAGGQTVGCIYFHAGDQRLFGLSGFVQMCACVRNLRP